jgi:hypothetical protein
LNPKVQYCSRVNKIKKSKILMIIVVTYVTYCVISLDEHRAAATRTRAHTSPRNDKPRRRCEAGCGERPHREEAAGGSGGESTSCTCHSRGEFVHVPFAVVGGQLCTCHSTHRACCPRRRQGANTSPRSCGLPQSSALPVFAASPGWLQEAHRSGNRGSGASFCRQVGQ